MLHQIYISYNLSNYAIFATMNVIKTDAMCIFALAIVMRTMRSYLNVSSKPL